MGPAITNATTTPGGAPRESSRSAIGISKNVGSAASVPMSAVTAILITHVHPDHHGQSGKVAEQSGAWVGMHPAEDAFLERRGNAMFA